MERIKIIHDGTKSKGNALQHISRQIMSLAATPATLLMGYKSDKKCRGQGFF